MRKNSFISGTLVAYAAIVISKLLGALYSIPFYNIIGEEGGVIYSCAYNIYALFLDISTSGIPIAVSIVISEYNTWGMYDSRDRAYRLALQVVSGLSLLSFLLMQLFAEPLGRYFLGEMHRGVTVQAVANGIRAVSLCLLAAPVLSIQRGYLQGQKFLTAPSQSQVIEQLVRIAVVLAGSYLAIRVLHWGVTAGVCIALLGAAFGALAALLFLKRKSRPLKAQRSAEPREPFPASKGEILQKLFSYCLTIVIMSVSISIYSLVDMKMLLVGLHKLHYSDVDTQVIASIASTWIPKICMIITALSMGLVSSLAPHMAESHSLGDHAAINQRLNQSLSTLVLLAVPMGVGMMLLAEPVFRLFYGQNVYGPGLLAIAVVVNVVGSMATVTSMSMQSIGRGRTVCIVTILGIVLNTALDLPLIYLFHFLGLPAHLGASAASIVGQGVTLGMLLWALRRRYGFRYRAVLEVLVRVTPGILVMGLGVTLLRQLWHLSPGRGLGLIAQLLVYALLGGGVYLLCALKTGALEAVLGRALLTRIRERFVTILRRRSRK